MNIKILAQNIVNNPSDFTAEQIEKYFEDYAELRLSDVSDSEKTIKHIVKKTHYWLFKKTNDESKYYYVRTMTEGLDRVVWFMGYENHFGSVSSVGGELSDETQKQLESEFQQSN